MDEILIKDIPSIKKTLDEIRSFSALKKAFPLFRPFLKLFKIDISSIDDAFSNFDDLSRQVEDFAVIPDRFNDLFSEQGWIIYDLMNFEVTKRAVEVAESEGIEKAEEHLINYYSLDTIRWKLQTMKAVKEFLPRIPLAEKALIDYENERYHACVLVVLSLIDGLVNALHEKRRGFFSKNIDLSAWDSMSAHSKGLNVLAKIFQRGRYKTTTEQITIPFRNGIMHGMDLGYDNKIVAIKSWAALFATRDWALKAERGLLTAPPSAPEKSWSDIFKTIKETENLKKSLDQWRPRQMVIGQDIPEKGTPELFSENSPERKLIEYLTYWKANNYGYMADCISPLVSPPVKKAAAHVRDMFASKRLNTFILKSLSDDAASVTEINTELIYDEFGHKVTKPYKFRLIYSDLEGNAAIRGMPNSMWTIINWAVS